MRKILTSLALLTGFSFIYNNSTLVAHAEENTISVFDKSDVLDDLRSSKEFNESDFVIDENLSLEEGIESILLFEYGYHDLYLYIANKSGIQLNSDYDFRISMSVDDEVYSYSKTYLYNYYNLNLINFSDNYLFYKFKVDYTFEKYTDLRTYAITDLDIAYNNSFASGNTISINDIFTYEGYGDNISYTLNKLTTIQLDPLFGYYRTDTLNSNSTYYDQVFTDISYIVFPVNKTYGNIVNINLSWSTILHHFLVIEEFNMFSWLYDSIHYSYFEDHGKTEDFNLTYSSLDIKESLSVDDSSSWNRFLVNSNPLNWFYDHSNDYKLKVIEKISYPFEDYYLNNETINYLKDNYELDEYLLCDFYVIRFSYDDFINSTVVSGVAGDGVFTSSTTTTHCKKTDIINLDVLTLTFNLLGKIYSLPVNMQPVDIPKSWVRPTPSITNLLGNLFTDDFNDTLRTLLILIGVILLIWMIPFIKWVIKILKKIFKSNSSKKTKNLNKNKKNQR